MALDTLTCSTEEQARISAAYRIALDAQEANNIKFAEEICNLFGEAAKSDQRVVDYAKSVDAKSNERTQNIDDKVTSVKLEIATKIADVYKEIEAKLKTVSVELTEVQLNELYLAIDAKVTTIVNQTINNFNTEIVEFKEFWEVIREFLATNNNNESVIDLLKSVKEIKDNFVSIDNRVTKLETLGLEAKTNECVVYAVAAEYYAALSVASTDAQNKMLEILKLCVIGKFNSVEA